MISCQKSNKECFMKNTIRILGLIAIAVIIGFSMTACGDGNDGACTGTHNWAWGSYESGSGLRSCQNKNCTETAGIGDTGPGGGKIFYVETVEEGGFDVISETDAFTSYKAYYLEASPGNIGNAIRWDNATVNSSSLVTEGEFGTGRNNTHLMHEFQALAARQCRDYRGPNNLEDWFLPNINELFEILRQKSVVGITTGIFWSSTTFFNSIWVYDFSKDHEALDVLSESAKTTPRLIRAIRAF
jgi:hypothetical protein